tara:strand:+ start:80 stop:1756 length:1677 start_codon:yes stop_codon:yes gene_type:complete
LTGTGAFILALAVISNYNSINPSESYWELLYLSGWISIYACFMIYSTRKTMKYIIVTSSIVGAVLSLFLFHDVLHATYQSYRNTIPIYLTETYRNTIPMLSATFGYRNYFGQYLCFTVPASVISMFILKSHKAKLYILICFLINLGGLILTRTRSAWLGIFIALIVFIYLNRYGILSILQSIKKSYILISILISSISLVIYFLNLQVSSFNKGSVWQTITTIKKLKTDHDWGGRLNMYKSAVGIIRENPYLGIGLGNWRLVSPKYADNTAYTDTSFTKIVQRPHNDFLWVLSEVGIIGMVFVVGFLIYHLRLLLRGLNRGENSEDERYLLLFCLISLIAIGIESMFDFPRQRTMPNLYLWSIMGFIATTSIQDAGKAKYQNAVPKVLAAILSVVSVFAYFDLKSNIYSQDAKYYNNNNMPKELYASSTIALSYYRNLDNAGTPIYYYMGISKHQLGDKSAAKLFFQKALQLAPFHIGALTNYMILLGELGELTSAHKIMSIIQHVYPRMAKSRLDMAKFYLREGKNEEAEKILLELKEANLDDGQGTLDKLLLHVGKK